MEKKNNTKMTTMEKMMRHAFRVAIKAKALELLESTATPEEIEECKELTAMTGNPYIMYWWNVNFNKYDYIPKVTGKVGMEELVIWYDGEDGVPECKLDTEVSFEELGKLLGQLTDAIAEIDREIEDFRQFLIKMGVGHILAKTPVK